MLRSPFHLSLDGLLVGCICAFLHYHRSEFAWLEHRGVVRGLYFGGVLVSGYLLCARPLLDSVSWFNVTFLYTLLAFSFGAVLLSLVSGRAPCAPFFRARGPHFFSKISYSLYLVHMIFMGIVFVVLRDHFELARFSVGLQFALYFPVFCACSIVGALALHYTIEKPFLILKDRLGAPRPRPSDVASAALTA